ncbi:MAG: hypothetical protein GY749_03465 [Desulfobacteraceae bacterium]|nr:hypothetical protein [Desulfobacteraceae bacterium]
MAVRVFSRCDEERRNCKAVKTTDPYRRTSDYTGVGRRQVPSMPVITICVSFRKYPSKGNEI